MDKKEHAKIARETRKKLTNVIFGDGDFRLSALIAKINALLDVYDGMLGKFAEDENISLKGLLKLRHLSALNLETMKKVAAKTDRLLERRIAERTAANN